MRVTPQVQLVNVCITNLPTGHQITHLNTEVKLHFAGTVPDREVLFGFQGYSIGLHQNCPTDGCKYSAVASIIKIYAIVFTPSYRSKEVYVEGIHGNLLSSVGRRKYDFINFIIQATCVHLIQRVSNQSANTSGNKKSLKTTKSAKVNF